MDQHELSDRFGDRLWRLENLYFIKDRKGNKVKFTLNRTQRLFIERAHKLNVILKARQLGFTTLIQIMMLDAALFNSGTSCGVVAQTREDAQEFFDDKIKFAYENLPIELRSVLPATSDSARSLKFSNGSRIVVGTSLRGGTYQWLHVSEYGKICAQYPKKAKEIRTGALNTVHAGQVIFIESTAEGQEGDFYELCKTAEAKEQSGTILTDLDFRFHFFPWWQDPEYQIDPTNVIFTPATLEYFRNLESKHGIELTDAQRAWYVKKMETQRDEMKREYPSVPEEAFEAAVEGAYYAREMAQVRKDGRITSLPYDNRYLVNTFWDLGVNDMLTIWFHQRVGNEHRFIDYYEGSGEGLSHYAAALRERGYAYDTHYWPHDGHNKELGTGDTLDETARNLGIRPLQVTPRTRDIRDGIQAVRNVLSQCWFDEAKCSKGIGHLDRYRKEWDDNLGVFKNRPRHDEASHGADGFRTFAEGYQEPSKANWNQGSTSWVV